MFQSQVSGKNCLSVTELATSETLISDFLGDFESIGAEKASGGPGGPLMLTRLISIAPERGIASINIVLK